MDGPTLLMIAVALVILACCGIALAAIIQLKKKNLNKKPNEFQFSKRKYIAGEGFIDTNIAKAGKTKTFLSFFSKGFISWEDFFNPKNEEQKKLRDTARYCILGFYIIAGLITATTKYMDLPLGFYIGLLMIAYTTLIIGLNYIRYHK